MFKRDGGTLSGGGEAADFTLAPRSRDFNLRVSRVEGIGRGA
jgi:hypothetical protein